MEGVRQVGGPVIQGTLSGSCSLDGESEGSNHSQSSVLELSNLQNLLFLWVVSKVQRVKELSSWVETLLRVELRIPLELDVSDNEGLDIYKTAGREGKGQTQVRRSVHQFVLQDRIGNPLITTPETQQY
jgi:hypothetical protein